jgi:hypothetical protein
MIDSRVRKDVDEAMTIRNGAVHVIDREPLLEEAQVVLNAARGIAKIP